ncbi:MAG: hypothetical protein Pg6C_04540 [Treponemataceae bacterium]|nr:MAG: hypothetical protein Pg6C_04540 [Treponemataceae bacterium]
MTIEQTIDIPASHCLTIEVPREVPAGRAILAFTPASAAVSRDDDVTARLNRYYAGCSPESDNDVRQAAYRLFAQEDW